MQNILPKGLILYLVVVPLAILIGYLLADPMQVSNIAPVVLLLFLLLAPVALKHHHSALILSWNSFLTVFFLPGAPSLGVVVAIFSFMMTTVERTMRKTVQSIRSPSTTVPLLIIACVVITTIVARGGIGGHAMGSDAWGAKRYVSILAAVIGYFALLAKPIERKHAAFLVGGFFLSGATAIMSDLIYAAGPAFYPLFILFSTEVASMQAFTEGTLNRLTGVAWASQAVFYFLIARYGIRGLLDLSKPWRVLLFLAAVVASLFGGYRSTIVVLVLVLAVQFVIERLHRTAFLPILSGTFMIAGVFTIVFVDQMPLAVQRSLSFLPINVNQEAKIDAAGTLDWRLQMWKVVIPDVPKYLILGKGYSFSGTDFILTQEATKRGLYTAYEETLVSGNYHNGILTILIPFGLGGLLGFGWFCIASLKVLRRNLLYGDPALRLTNTFLYSYFIARLGFYIFFYGQFDSDLLLFVGILGFSLSLNNGVASPARMTSVPIPEALPEPVDQPLTVGQRA